MHWYWNGHHWGWMLLWWVAILAILVGIVWAVLVRVRRRSGSPEDTPERALKRRYARGEIDRETYERMLEDLRR